MVAVVVEVGDVVEVVGVVDEVAGVAFAAARLVDEQHQSCCCGAAALPFEVAE